MSKARVSRPRAARQGSTPKPPADVQRSPKPLTLADVSISWKEGDTIRTVTGRQIATLLTAAAERIPADAGIGDHAIAERWVYRMRGAAAIVYPDAGESIYADDARAFVSGLLEDAAADLAAVALDHPGRAAEFIVHTAKADDA